MKIKRKGFTLIELIVVMAIIAILVLIAAPKFMGYTEKAKLTQVINDIKVSEKAAEQYYLEYDLWPRDQTATPYTVEQLNTWVSDFKNLSGETTTLEDGDYYDIDWELMKPFMSKPNNNFRYIIQNPVGDIYYAAAITNIGENLGKFSNELPKELNYTGTDYLTAESNGTLTITDYVGTSTDIVIPGLINGKVVTAIGSSAFRGNSLTSVVIPNSVTSIGASAFHTNRLSSINIPNGVTTISSFAFRANLLTSVVIPNSVTSIGIGAFLSNQLTSVTIPNSITSISASTFAANKLTSITIPNSVTSIGISAFNINLLTSVTIPANVTLESTDSISNSFYDSYNSVYSKVAGTYTAETQAGVWTK